MPPPSADDRSPENDSSGSASADDRSIDDQSADDRSANDRSDGPDSYSITTALVSTGRVLRDRPGAILTAYLLALGTLQVAIAPAFLGLVAALLSLSAAGRLGPAIDALPALADAVGPPGEPAGPTGPGVVGGGEAVPPETIEALSGLVTPTSAGAIGLGILGGFLVWVLARVITNAITQGTVWAAIDGRAPLVDGLATAGRWRTFLGLAVLRVGVFLAALLPAVLVALGAGAFAALGAGSPTGGGNVLAGLGAILAALLALGGALLGVLAQFLLLFAGPAAVVDERGTLGAARASFGFVRSHFVAALAFGLVVIGSYVALSVLAGLLSVAGVAGILAPVLPLVLSPLLDTAGTALYAGRGVERVDNSPLYARIGRSLRRGVRELGVFPREVPLATLLGALSLAGAIALGYLLTASYGEVLSPPGDVTGVFGTVPIDTFATLAVNNWVVSARLAFGGVALAVPAIVGLAFNGLLVGGLAGVSDPMTFLALVAPHGILELPTVALAGGIGIHLGHVGWRALRGRADAPAVADELKRTGVLLVGIALLLIAAAFIEAFVTPRVAAAVVG